MHKAFKFRIYPTEEQTTLIHKSIGCSRFVFNHFLAKWNNTYKDTGKGLTYNVCSKRLTALKKEIEWLKEVDAHCLQSSLRHLDDSFQRFFKKQNDKPRFKSRRNRVQAYTTKIEKNNQLPEVSIQENKIKLPKLGWVRFAKSREVEGRILSATIRRTPTRTYQVSVLCEMDRCPYVPAKGGLRARKKAKMYMIKRLAYSFINKRKLNHLLSKGEREKNAANIRTDTRSSNRNIGLK